MKKILFVMIAVLITFFGKAQEDAQYSHYMFNQMTINPGYAGSVSDIVVTAFNRQQWVGFSGAPVTSNLSISSPFTLFGVSSGVALSIENDQIGWQKRFKADLSYAYKRSFLNGEIGLGIDFGLQNENFDSKGQGKPPVESEPILTTADKATAFNINLGAYFHNEDYYCGLSITHVNQPQLNMNLQKPFAKRHYFLTGGYNFQLPFPLFEITPSFLIKSDGASSQLDINAICTYNKKIWGGISYRISDCIIGLIGIELKNGIRLGYAYDFTTSAIRSYSSGTHEVMLSYSFGLKFEHNKQVYRSVRFL